jgi:hypothetical protein
MEKDQSVKQDEAESPSHITAVAQSVKQEEDESHSQLSAVALPLANENIEENEGDTYAYGHLNLEDRLESGVASVDGPSSWHGGDTDHVNVDAKEVAGEMGDPVLENTEEGAPQGLPPMGMEGNTEGEFCTDKARTLLRAPLSVAERIAGPSTGSVDSGRKGSKKRVENTKSDNETSSDSVRLGSCDMVSSPQSPSSTMGARKLSKKRMRRVGVSVPKKQGKTESPDPIVSVNTDSNVATTSVADSMARVPSKHDEKWNSMFDKLVAFKVRHTLSFLVNTVAPIPVFSRSSVRPRTTPLSCLSATITNRVLDVGFIIRGLNTGSTSKAVSINAFKRTAGCYISYHLLRPSSVVYEKRKRQNHSRTDCTFGSARLRMGPSKGTMEPYV